MTRLNRREKSNEAAIRELKGKITKEELNYKMNTANKANEELAIWKEKYNLFHIDTSVIPNHKKNKKITYCTVSKLQTKKKIYL